MIWINFAASLGAALVVLLIAFAVGASIGKHRVVDIAWGLGFAAVALTSFGMSASHGDVGRRVLVTALTVIWGVRLAVHIAWRARGAPEDPRYTELLAKGAGVQSGSGAGSGSGSRAGNLRALRSVYLIQAVTLWFVSFPVQVAEFDKAPLSWWIVFGLVIWAVGFFFESVGDLQLTRFKSDPANKGKVLDTGLWRFTRHPNYFGDACVWWGLYLLGVGWWPGIATILSPILMTWLLAGKTGRPLLDAHMTRTRPEYADYVKRTSGFIPRPPARSAA
jgi:steroid 5-alpha reductase family enzyme